MHSSAETLRRACSVFVVAGALLVVACDGRDRQSTPTTTAPTAVDQQVPGLETLPPVDRFTYPTGGDDVVMQALVRAPLGPDVPLLTVYGDGVVVAATNDGWRTGVISDLDVQGLLDDAEGVGLLGEPLVLRSGSVTTQNDGSSSAPDIIVRFDVNGRTLVHEFDLARIERPPGIRALVNNVTVANRFDLSDIFEPGAWIACTDDGCELVPAAVDSSSRPVLPHEDPAELL